MAFLKLLLCTGLMINFVPAVTTQKSTENKTTTFNAALQNEILIPLLYDLRFELTSIFNVMPVRAYIIFKVREPIRHIGIYKYGFKIQNNIELTGYVEFKDGQQNYLRTTIDKQYIVGNIHVLEFSEPLSIHTHYELHVSYTKPKDKDYSFGHKRPNVIDGMLYRLLDSTNGFHTISLTAEYSVLPVDIKVRITSSSPIMIFTNVKAEIGGTPLKQQKQSYAIMYQYFYRKMLINQIVVLLGVKFERATHEQINFEHSLKIKNEINYALSTSHELWLYAQNYTPNLSQGHKDLEYPALNVVSSNDDLLITNSLGIIVYRKSDISYNDITEFSGRRNAIALTIAYETARQIFNFLYPSSWSAKCLQESLAVYLHYEMFRRFETLPETGFNSDPIRYLYVVQILQPTLHFDGALRSKPISHGNNLGDEIDKAFLPRFFYNKASALVRAFGYTIKLEKLKNIIWRYIREHAFKQSSNVEFCEFIQIAKELKDDFPLKQNFKVIMRTWFAQAHYPIVLVESDYTLDKLLVKLVLSKCHHGDGTIKNCVGVYNVWSIPLYYVTFWQGNRTTYALTWKHLNDLDVHPISFAENVDFIIINWKQAGYYRVHYDDANWLRIAQFLNYENYKEIHVLNRAQIIDDAYYFVMNEQMEWTVFLQIIRYLKRETSFIAWYPMMNIMFYMTPYLRHSSSNFIKWTLLEILDGLLKNIEYQDHPTDDDMIKSLRLLAMWWTCKFRHHDCLEYASTKLLWHFQDHKNHPLKPLWDNFVYCGGLMIASETTYDKAINIYDSTGSESLLKGMACNENPTNILKFFKSLTLKHDAGFWTRLTHEAISPFLKRFTITNRHLLADVLDMLRSTVEGRLRNINVWADIILNTYSEELLSWVQMFYTSLVRIVTPMSHRITALCKLQKQRIKKLRIMDYYV